MSVHGRMSAGSSGSPSRVMIHLGSAAVPIDIVSLDEVISWILGSGRDCWQVMVTPNLHHLRVIRSAPHIATCYTDAALSLADGWPVAWLASRVAGCKVERVVGEVVLQALIDRQVEGRRLVLVGGQAGPELDRLFDQCRQRGWQVSGEPALRAELVDPVSRADLVRRIAHAGSEGIVVLGVGMPRQEQLASEIAALPGVGAVLCLGMSINFSAGVARPTPGLVQALALESLYRVIQEPRRLLRRYARDSLVLPALLARNPRRRVRGGPVEAPTARPPDA